MGGMSIFGGSSTEEEASEENNEQQPDDQQLDDQPAEDQQVGEPQESDGADSGDSEPRDDVDSEDGAGVDGEGDTDIDSESDESEVIETEAVVVDDAPEEPEDLPTASVGGSQLATFTSNFGGFSFKIIPQSTSSGLTWSLVVYASGTQGPVFQTKTPVTESQAAEFGLPEDFRRRLNRALEFARSELSLPSELRTETADRSLEDLEMLMEERG